VQGNPAAIAFPRALAGKNNFEFSFSGLKSAVLNYLHSAAQRGEAIQQADVAASFQAAVVDVLTDKALQAAAYCGVKQVVLAGGVAANSGLKKQLSAGCSQAGIALYYPQHILCTDNAAMIACRAYYQYTAGRYADLCLNALPSLKLGS
jgi:N6-L-threonylcarbamoyladenine synthase